MSTKKNFNTYNIAIIGVGGTGGLLTGILSRYLYSVKASNDAVAFNIALVDADRVSESNISRQPFLPEEVGQFKTDCLSEAMREIYSLNVTSVPEYINSPADIKKVFSYCKNVGAARSAWLYDEYIHNIIIGCVDNHRARQEMHKYFDKWETDSDKYDLYYIDSANEYDYATCICGYRDCNGEHTPPRAFFFPNILEDKGKSASELSCGEVNVSAPQHLITNQMAANVILSKLVSFITENKTSFCFTYRYPFKCEMVHRDETSFGLEAGQYHEMWKGRL